jgi:hypothetical protein
MLKEARLRWRLWLYRFTLRILCKLAFGRERWHHAG